MLFAYDVVHKPMSVWIDGRNCGSTRTSCRTQLSVNHRPLNCFRYVTFWMSIENSLLSVGVVVGGSRGSRSVVLARWSPTPPKTLSTMIRYVAVSNELQQLSFALYRDADVNVCYINETVTPLTKELLEVLAVNITPTSQWLIRGFMGAYAVAAPEICIS